MDGRNWHVRFCPVDLSFMQLLTMERSLLDKYRRLELEHWWFRVRSGILTDGMEALCEERKGLRILNVGAATGRSTEILQPYGDVVSVEYDEPSFLFCKEVLKMDIVRASILELPFANDSFDIVCCFDVIEHVEDDGKAVEELVRVCRPGGAVFITVPAFMSLWSDHDRVNQHFRRYRESGLKVLFSAHKGRTVRSTYFNSLLFLPIWLVRRLQRLLPGNRHKPLKADNEFLQSRLTDRIFGAVFSMERSLLRRVDFPFGVSLMSVWRKS